MTMTSTGVVHHPAIMASTYASILLLIWLWPLSSNAATLQPYSAQYATTVMGVGVTLERRLTVDDAGLYTLTNEGGVFLAQLKEVSRFSINEGQLHGKGFSYRLKGISRRERAVEFRPDEGTIRSLRKKRWTEHPWQPDILDRLSQQAQLRLSLMASDEPPISLAFNVIDGPRIKTRTLAFMGLATIEVEAGTFSTWHFKQVRENSERLSEIWVAPELDFLMVKPRHEEDGANVTIELKDSSLLLPSDH